MKKNQSANYLEEVRKCATIFKEAVERVSWDGSLKFQIRKGLAKKGGLK